MRKNRKDVKGKILWKICYLDGYIGYEKKYYYLLIYLFGWIRKKKEVNKYYKKIY